MISEADIIAALTKAAEYCKAGRAKVMAVLEETPAYGVPSLYRIVQDFDTTAGWIYDVIRQRKEMMANEKNPHPGWMWCRARFGRVHHFVNLSTSRALCGAVSKEWTQDGDRPACPDCNRRFPGRSPYA